MPEKSVMSRLHASAFYSEKNFLEQVMKAGRRVHLGTLKDQNEMMVVKKCIKFWNFRSGLILRGFSVHGTLVAQMMVTLVKANKTSRFTN